MTDLSQALFYSSRQCQRILQNNLGVNFLQVLTDIRLTKAKGFLKNTDLSVQEIAEKCGFHSSQKLSSAFRKRFEKTPVQYRKEKKKHAEQAS